MPNELTNPFGAPVAPGFTDNLSDTRPEPSNNHLRADRRGLIRIGQLMAKHPNFRLGVVRSLTGNICGYTTPDKEDSWPVIYGGDDLSSAYPVKPRLFAKMVIIMTPEQFREKIDAGFFDQTT